MSVSSRKSSLGKIFTTHHLNLSTNWSSSDDGTVPGDSAIALGGPERCAAAERAGLSGRLYEHQREL